MRPRGHSLYPAFQGQLGLLGLEGRRGLMNPQGELAVCTAGTYLREVYRVFMRSRVHLCHEVCVLWQERAQHSPNSLKFVHVVLLVCKYISSSQCPLRQYLVSQGLNLCWNSATHQMTLGLVYRNLNSEASVDKEVSFREDKLSGHLYSI